MSKVKQFGVLCLLLYCFVIGCFVFCRGFLLNRQVLADKSSQCRNDTLFVIPKTVPSSGAESNGLLSTVAGSWCHRNPPFQKAVFLLLDAFRYDFIHRMSFLSTLLEREESNARNRYGNTTIDRTNSFSCAFKSIADPPTTTMQRLKALMSGTMPTFIDASANFNSYEVEEDNLIYQFHEAGKRIAFFGDDTWLSLFPKSLFTSQYVEAHPSFNAWDLDTVDRAVNASIIRLLESNHISNWDILIAHLLGVDHCGHRYGPAHVEMQRKLAESDKIIENIFNKMSVNTLLIVFGDHGMTKTGDHGGDSNNEVEAALVFISKQTKRSKVTRPPFDCHSKFKSPQVVSQIDLVPTVSLLLGYPIPFSSIGQVIPKFLMKSVYTEAIMTNVVQVSKYVSKYATISTSELSALYDRVEQAFITFMAEKNSITRVRLHNEAEFYLVSVRKLALSAWTRFDIASMYWGLVISLVAISATCCYLQWMHSHDVHWMLLAFSGSGVLSVLINFALGPTFGLIGIKFMTTIGLICFLLSFSSLPYKTLKPFDKTVSLRYTKNTTITESLSISFYFFTCVAMFSNSFVISEGYVLGSVLLMTSFLHVLQSFERKELLQFLPSNTIIARSNLMSKKMLIWKHGIRTSWISLFSLAILMRMATLFFRCREELTKCQEEYLLHKHLASLPEDWVVHKCIRFGIALLSVAVFAVSFREWIMMSKYINHRPASLIGKYMPTLLIVLTGAHWALEGLPFSLPHMLMIRPALNNFPVIYQMLTVLAIAVVWIDPLCTMGSSTAFHQFEDKGEQTQRSDLSTVDQVDRVTTSSLWKKSNEKHITPGDNSYLINTTDTTQERYGNEGLILVSKEAVPEDVFSTPLLINGVLIVLLLIEVTTTGITPAIVMIPYVVTAISSLSIISLDQDSWSVSVLWTLASQYFFYGTGHQAVFSAIPWDSAFIASAESLGSSRANSWLSWIRPGLAVLGNLHTSQIIFSMALPLVVYWRSYTIPKKLFGKSERSRVYLVGGKFIILHAVKLLACMMCATHHRRHLMVWKIFAPKLIFEILSFLVTLTSLIISLLFVTRIDYHYQKALRKDTEEQKNVFRSNP